MIPLAIQRPQKGRTVTEPPDWCTQEYLNQYVGGNLRISNVILNYSYIGEIAELSLNDGELKVRFTWLAAGMDANNRRSGTIKEGFVLIEKLDCSVTLFIPPHPEIPGDCRRYRFAQLPTDNDWLKLDSGELGEALLFVPHGTVNIRREEARSADPDNPVDLGPDNTQRPADI